MGIASSRWPIPCRRVALLAFLVLGLVATSAAIVAPDRVAHLAGGPRVAWHPGASPSAPAPVLDALPPRAQAPAPTQRSWDERQVILERNVFKASTGLGEAPPVEEVQEEYEATELPVRLLATVASGVPALSWAAVEDTRKRESQVVRLQDQLADSATVVAIERRRVVLENRGRREELAFEEADPAAARPAPRAA